MNLERSHMFGSPLHNMFFMYFTVHAHEDRHGTGLMYQIGASYDDGGSPKGTVMLSCRECDYDVCPECVKSKGDEVVCPGKHETKEEETPYDGVHCQLCSKHPVATLQKHMGDVLNKYFPKPPPHAMARIFDESTYQWNYTIAVSNMGGGADLFSANGECATNLADHFKWDKDILTDIFKALVKTAEEDKVMVEGELDLLNALGGLWEIDNPEQLYSDNVEFREPPPKPKIEFDDDGDPLCLECGGSMYKPMASVGVSMTFGPGGVTQRPIDDTNTWICNDCGYSFDID